MKRREYRQNRSMAVMAVFCACLWIFAVYLKCGIYFETNDDRYIGEILSGALVGRPSGHAVYVNWLLAGPLSLLFTCWRGVSWYGLFLTGAQATAYALLLYSMYRACSSCLLPTFLGACLFLSSLQLLGNIQYTSTAALLAIAGYTCLLLLYRSFPGGGLLFFFLLEGLAILLRDQAMLMIQPMGLAAYGGLILTQELSLREKARQLLKPLLLLVILFLISRLSAALAYRSPEWKDYLAFNKAGTDLFDYYGCPDYEQVRPILDRYHVSEAEYEGYRSYVILDTDLPAPCVRELALYAKEHRFSSAPLLSLPARALRSRLLGDWHGINRLCSLLWAGGILWVLLLKRYRLIGPLAGLAAVQLLIWSYLEWRGRTPFRIMAPLLIGEIWLVTALLLSDHKNLPDRRRGSLAGLILCLLLGFGSYASGRAQYRYVRAQNEGQRIFMTGLYELEDYCLRRPDKRYIIGQQALSYYRGSALDGRMYGAKNRLVTGTWYSGSPPTRDFLDSYLPHGFHNLYLILYDGEATLDHAALAYLQEKSGSLPVLADSLTLSHGGRYSVYYFQ